MRVESTDPYNALNAAELTGLRDGARNGDADAVQQVAKQFESIFVQMMLKGMRDASIGDGGLFSSNATEQYRQLFDRQVAMQTASGRGFGIAALVERQMSARGGVAAKGVDKAEHSAASLADYRRRALPARTAPPVAAAVDALSPGGRVDAPGGTVKAAGGEAAAGKTNGRWDSPGAFVEDILPAARRTAETLGVPAEALVAQAALETGWGARTLRAADGTPSFNLFNIKAHGWHGARVRVPTLEYRDGVAVREHAEFRAYGSVDEAFADYADLLRDNPRYRQALSVGRDNAAGFAEALEAAGYATDPHYADKLRRILDGPTFEDTVAGLKDSAERTTT